MPKSRLCMTFAPFCISVRHRDVNFRYFRTLQSATGSPLATWLQTSTSSTAIRTTRPCYSRTGLCRDSRHSLPDSTPTCTPTSGGRFPTALFSIFQPPRPCTATPLWTPTRSLFGFRAKLSTLLSPTVPWTMATSSNAPLFHRRQVSHVYEKDFFLQQIHLY